MSHTRTVQGRAHDHVYDREYTVSDHRDHVRAHQRATMRAVERVPEFNNMFSEVARYPAHQYRLSMQPGSAPPAHMHATYEGPHNNNVVPDMSSVDVSRDRHKYFKRPVIPYLTSVPPEVVLSRAKKGKEAAEPVEEPKSKTVATQSMYRESEAQTNPYTPAYTVPEGEDPELLTLTNLTHGQGLPAGLKEVEMIERARQRRAFEAGLPPLSDPDSFDKRQKLMEEQELKEWAEREEQIRLLQEERLDHFRAALEAREDQSEELTNERIQGIYTRKIDEKEMAMTKIQQRRIKALRKLSEARKNVEGKRPKRDIVTDYADYGSKTYAPLTRDGVFPERTVQTVTSPRALEFTVDAIRSLQHTVPKSMTAVSPEKAESMKIKSRSAAARRDQQIASHLNKMEERIRNAKTKQKKSIRELTIAQKVEKPPPRPPTPSTQPPVEDDDKVVAIGFLQRLLRGRAIQNMMFEGKVKRQELIDELRTEAVEAELQAAQEGEPEDLEITDLDAALEEAQADVLGTALDFLAKELVRNQEYSRLQSMYQNAEKTRREREHIETEQRVQEEFARQQRDECFRQIMGVHHAAVDTLLDEIVDQASEETAEKLALHETSIRANQLDVIISSLEAESNPPRTIVRDLVAGFLLPEVERRYHERRTGLDQTKYLLAAHKGVLAAVEEVSREASQHNQPSRDPPGTDDDSTSVGK